MSYQGRKSKPPSRSGDEHDAFSRNWRRWLHWHEGIKKRIRRRFHKRDRRLAKKELQDADRD